MSVWKRHWRIQAAGGFMRTKELSAADLRNVADARAIFGKLRRHLYREELIDHPRDLRLIFLQSPRLEAFPLKIDDQFAICISIGMLRAVWNVLILTLCDDKIFPGYGGEKATYKIRRRIGRKLIFGPAIMPLVNSGAIRKGDATLPSQSITPSREELCQLLFDSIIDYLFYHEAMHITRDHLSFIQVFHHLDHIDEAEVSRGMEQRFFQFLEIDADLVALGVMLPTNPELSAFDQLTDFDKGDFVFGQMFSNIIIQQLFDLEGDGVSIQKQWKKLHPPPLIRSMLYDNVLHRFFLQQNLLPKQEIRDQQQKAWWEASRIAIKLGFPSGRWHGKTLEGISVKKFDRLIPEFNAFQDVIERSHQSGDYKEIRRVIKRL